MTRIQPKKVESGGILYAGKKEFMDGDLSYVRRFEVGFLPSLGVKRTSTFKVHSSSHRVPTFPEPIQNPFQQGL